MPTKLTAKFVIGYADGDHVIYPDGEIVCDGDPITLVGRTKAFSDEWGCPIRLHAAPGAQGADLLRARHGRRPLELPGECRIFGPRTPIPHATTPGGGADTPFADLALPRDSGGVLDPFDRYRRAGINLAPRTDPSPPDYFARYRAAHTARDYPHRAPGDLFPPSFTVVHAR